MAREMKDSGIEWIGEIPINWHIIKLKYVATMQPSCDTSTLNDNSIITYTPMVFIKTGYYITNTITFGEVSSSLTPYNEGDIVLAKVTPCFENGNIAIMSNLCSGFGLGSSELYVIRANYINTKFLFYWLQNKAFVQMGCSTMTGTGGLKRVASSFINNCPLSVPESHEQQAIADFLDAQCAHIDSVVEKTRTAIEEYKKLKQSVITQAVAKGIRPNRKMKDSGIEWIGKMPKDWMLIPFRHVLNERNEKNSPVRSTERLSLSIDLGVTLYSEKTTNLDRFKDDFEQYKIAHKGDLVMNSMNMIVGATGVSSYYGCVSPAYYTFYDDTENHITAKLCEYIFRSKTMLRVLFSMGKGIYAIVRGDDRVNTCRLKVSRDDLRSIQLPIPLLDEQSEIVAYLDEKTAAIDSLIQKKEQLITELEAYKKSLIYEYVTGKKEVV